VDPHLAWRQARGIIIDDLAEEDSTGTRRKQDRNMSRICRQADQGDDFGITLAGCENGSGNFRTIASGGCGPVR